MSSPNNFLLRCRPRQIQLIQIISRITAVKFLVGGQAHSVECPYCVCSHVLEMPSISMLRVLSRGGLAGMPKKMHPPTSPKRHPRQQTHGTSRWNDQESPPRWAFTPLTLTVPCQRQQDNATCDHSVRDAAPLDDAFSLRAFVACCQPQNVVAVPIRPSHVHVYPVPSAPRSVPIPIIPN